MKAKKRILVVMLLMVLCLPMLGSLASVKAITSIPKDELPTNKGDQVTGDDIVNVGRYLMGINFTYSSVGTCTGFVTRILSYLQVGQRFVSRTPLSWEYCYNSSNWDVPYGGRYNAAWGPAGWKTQGDIMVREGTAEYIGYVPANNLESINSMGVQNGDILITPERGSVQGHVAIAYIENGRVKTFGAGGGSGNPIKIYDVGKVGNAKDGEIYIYRVANNNPKGKVRLHKVSNMPDTVAKGDSKIDGATYRLFAKEDIYEGATLVYAADQLVREVKTGIDGYTEWVEELPMGKYYWQEVQASDGYLLDTNKIDVELTRDTLISDEIAAEVTHIEARKYNRARVVKMNNDSGDSSEKDPAVGAVLRLTLVSDETQYYDAEIGEDGTAEFIDQNFKTQYPDAEYTIPYGTYKISEIRESNSGEHTHFFIQEYTLVLSDNNRTETVIVVDEAVDAHIQVVKTDAITNEAIKLTGAKFKIWDCQKGEFVTQIEFPSGNEISEFETNADGLFNTPQKLSPGKYIIYETQAPKGYILNEDWKLPASEADYGVEGKGGKLVDLNKETIGVKDDIQYDPDLTLIYKVEMPDYPQMVKLSINKTGEMLSEVKTSTVTYKVSETENENEEKYTPVYKMQGLEGVVYNIVATENIMSPDGNGIYVAEGEVVDTITTDKDGTATTKDLYPGTYKIVEIVTPVGYLKDTNIPNITMTNDEPQTPIKAYKKDLTDIRQKLELTFKKKFDDVNFSTGEEIKHHAIFGVYTNQQILNSQGKVAIPKDKLVDLIEVEGQEVDVTSNIDLPEGTYYVRELYASYPYTKSEETIYFDLRYNNSNNEFVVYEGEELVNTAETTSITLVKLASTTVDNIIMNGDDIDTSELDETIKEIINNIKGMTKDEIKEYFKQNNVKFIPGAIYGIYTDEDCKNQLKIYNEETGKYEEANIVTDDTGLITLENIPLGTYYIQEIEAPAGYEKSEQILKIELNNESKDTMIYAPLIENGTVTGFLTKKDIFTGEEIPNCKFEIRDEDGNLVLTAITDENGKGYIPTTILESGKKYTYTEVEAPEIYDLNKEPHEFIAALNEDGEWSADLIEVTNIRKKSTVELTKLDMIDATPIPNCKFELKSLETDWSITGVTDENGIYVFKDVPYGKYTYTELEAPEEYLIDTTPHEITIDAEEIKIIAKDERAPETGDIQVGIISMIALSSIVGIAFIVKKRQIN